MKDPSAIQRDLSISAEEYACILRSDLTSFIEASFYELYPGKRLDLAPHIEVVATKLERVRRGEIKRLIINLPPRHLKSHCVSVAFVVWMLGHDPVTHVICASYGQDLADEFASACQRLMRSSLYRTLFGDVLGGRQAVNDFETVLGGRRLATSVGGALTGRGADIIILDDPHKADEALSEPSRNATHSWFENTLLNRLNDRAQDAIIIVMQRQHPEDLVGHVLKKKGDWDVLRLPAIAEGEECHLIEGPLGRRFFRRRRGDALHPERESAASLAEIRRGVSVLCFASQYQQNPTSLEQIRARKAELDRRSSEAYRAGDWLTFGRIFHCQTTGTREDEITDEQAMAAYKRYQALAARIDSEY
ncbi:hypothetical protein IYY11_05040 [Methylocystis sp. H62]|uniref:hypothetical protein n=1 Tax=Methylocystis sp. H62 TaxID=2785789 RepID=UPI0018C2AB60|nr:hypothetical protein [Methylocystis sp. H62]MBG0792775.1 hypothetical protein [Methylocystis sp. H62]